MKNNPVSAFQIDADTSGAPDVLLHISGRITLSKSGAGAEGILASEARNIKWSSSDSSIAEVAECKVKSYLGDQIANLDITITPYKAGTATISGKTSNGKVASCKVTVKDDGKLGLKSVMYSYGSKTVDVLKSAHSVELEHKPFQLICTPDGNDLIKRYQLYSGKKKLYENTDGNFKEVDPSKFTKGEDVILQVYSDKKSLTALLLLEITDKKPLIGSLKLGDELAFTLDDDVPFVGGTEMKVSLPDIPVNAVIEDGKIKIGINIKEKELYAYNTEEGVTTTNKKKKGIKESFQDWKSELKKMGEEKDTYKASLLNNNYEEYLEKKDFKADMPFMSDKIKVTAVGYGEATWSDSLETVRLELIVTLSGSTTFQSQIFVFEVPATVNCTVAGKGQVDADAGYDFIEQKFFGNVGLEISVSVESYLGVGVGTYLSGGAYGQLKLGSGITVISTKKKSGVDNIYLAGELGAKAYFAKKEILRIPLFSIGDLKWTRLGQYINNKDQLLIYSRDGNSLIKKEASAKEAALPEPVFQWSEAEDSVYLSAPARMGEKAVTIVENAYGAAAPQIVTAGDTTLAVYLDNDTSRALANQTVVKYAVYNPGSGNFSAPQPLIDDGTADYMPRIYTDGTDIYAYYLDSTKSYQQGEDPEISAYAGNFAVTVAKYDAASQVFQKLGTVSRTGHYCYNPVLTATKEGLLLAWAENGSDNVFGTTEDNSVNWAVFANGSWQEPSCIADGQKCITSVAAREIGGTANLAYSVDCDNDLSTAGQQVFLVKGEGTAEYVAQGDLSQLQYARFPGMDQAVLAFNQNGAAAYLDSVSGQMVSVLADSTMDIGSPFTVVGNKIYYLKTIAEDARRIYCADYAGGKWNTVAVTEDAAYVDAYSVASNGMLLYLLTHVELSGQDAVNTTSAIKFMPSAERHDLALERADFDAWNMEAGKNLEMELRISNYGTETAERLIISFSPEGSLEEAQRVTLTEPLHPGETVKKKVIFTAPSDFTGAVYTLDVREIGVEDEKPEDNAMQVDLSKTELDVSSEYQIEDGKKSLVICVSNLSNIPAVAAITVTALQETVLYKEEGVAVPANGQVERKVSLDEVHLGEEGETVLAIGVTADAEEYYLSNNTCEQRIWKIDTWEPILNDNVLLHYSDWSGIQKGRKI